MAKGTYSLKDNDEKLIDCGARKTREVMWAAGAEEVVQEPRYAHLIGDVRIRCDLAPAGTSGRGVPRNEG